MFKPISACRLSNFFLAVGISCAVLQTAAAEPPKSGHKTVWDGVFNSAQADRGKISYTSKCGACHKADLSGYQSVLKGELFMEHWRETSLNDFYAAMSASMPRDAPGTLSENLYLDITAFILNANNFPAGSEELGRDALKGIQVEGKDGPKEVSTGALVDVVGCLAQGADNAWTLTQATEPFRTRNPNDSTADELKIREAKPLGTHSFELIDAALYHADTQKGFKVGAKGFIIRNPGNDRINLTTLQKTDLKCGS